MIPTVIVLCSGVDSSLLDLKLEPFRFALISANNPHPIECKELSYIYKAKCNPDGTTKEVYKKSTKVNTLYDFIQHLFPPYTSARGKYLQTEQYWDGTQYQYKSEPERFACFLSDSDDGWEKDASCLLNAIRLFKLNHAGFGLCIQTRGGIGLNDLYQHDTSTKLCGNPPVLPIFSLDETELNTFQDFYTFYRGWFYEENPNKKDQVARKLLDLYEIAYNTANLDTSLIILSQIWELFAQYFPDEEGGHKRGVSKRIKKSISNMIRNKSATCEETEDNLYKIVGYLYNQRCIIVHQDVDGEFDPACIPLAFDISRCLILKLIYIEDVEMEAIVGKIKRCG